MISIRSRTRIGRTSFVESDRREVCSGITDCEAIHGFCRTASDIPSQFIGHTTTRSPRQQRIFRSSSKIGTPSLHLALIDYIFHLISGNRVNREPERGGLITHEHRKNLSKLDSQNNKPSSRAFRW